MAIPARAMVRRGSAALWASINPILADGELGYESDTKTLRIGDGATLFSSLPRFRDISGLAGEFQVSDVNLTALSGLTLASNKLMYSTGLGTMALCDFPARARELLAQTNDAGLRSNLGLSPAAVLPSAPIITDYHAIDKSGRYYAGSDATARPADVACAVDAWVRDASETFPEIQLTAVECVVAGRTWEKYCSPTGGWGAWRETTSAAPQRTVFTASGTWTKPAGYPAETMVFVEAWGAGGNGGESGSSRSGGGGGGYAARHLRMGDIPASVAVVVGASGGNDSSFGSLLTALGGGNASGGVPGKGGGNPGLISGGLDYGPLWSGGGGGVSDSGGPGGSAIFGAGGGGGRNGYPGGTSLFGGGTGGGGGPAAQAPGGGGPAGSGSGAAGARGEVRVWL